MDKLPMHIADLTVEKYFALAAMFLNAVTETINENREVIRAIAATLWSYHEESVDFDNTENLYIESDNLDVLKLLRETYLNRIKMIYIDPLYNTGNDFVYRDQWIVNMTGTK